MAHVIFQDGLHPNDDIVAVLTRMPVPTNIKQFRNLLGDLSYYHKFLPNLARRIRPITAALKKGATFNVTPTMEKLVCSRLAELTVPQTLVFLIGMLL